MNISPTNNSNCFKGKLSPKVTKQIKKIQKKDICCLVYDNNCNRKLTSEDAINTINVHAKFIIRTLEKVANLLPQKAKICLKEEHNGSVYIQGKFSDKYTKYNFRIFRNKS